MLAAFGDVFYFVVTKSYTRCQLELALEVRFRGLKAQAHERAAMPAARPF
ncbi:MAG: hypothetical protein M3463_10765 [Verrucomicrobiota bacterium]|nr:hypothetical protein [Verrucomicrobiota bacterium]